MEWAILEPESLHELCGLLGYASSSGEYHIKRESYEDAHLTGQAMVSRGPDSPMMAANGNRVEMVAQKGVPRFPNGEAEPPPSSNPPQVAFDIRNNAKQKSLFKQRKEREFIPEHKKDERYWNRRNKNNESARRSRDKRRNTDKDTASRCVELTKENQILTAQAIAFQEENQSIKALMKENNGDDHNSHSFGGCSRREQLGSVSRTNDYSGRHGMKTFVAPTPSQLLPLTAIRKPHQRENRPFYKIDQGHYQNNQSNNTDHHSGRSGIPPSENILDLSLNGSQFSSESMEHDKEGCNGSGSSDGRDSGIFMNKGRLEKYLTENRQLSEAMDTGSPPQWKKDMKKRIEKSALENHRLKFELARLTAEVAYLKTFLSKKKSVGKEGENNQ